MAERGDLLHFNDGDVDLSDWQIPPDFDLQEVYHRLTLGPGWVLLKGMVSGKDVEMAKERIMRSKRNEIQIFDQKDVKQNNYNGLTWGLLHRGRIFTKLATHPVILSVFRAILGPSCRLSSLTANTVLPGMAGQQPHLDFPYYRHNILY